MVLSAVLLATMLVARPQSFVSPEALARGMTRATGETVSEAGRPFLRITTHAREGGQPWDSILHMPILTPIRQGDTMVVKARLRSPTGTRTSLHIELTDAPNTKFVSQTFLPTKTWHSVVAAGIADRDHAPGQSRLAMFLGYGAGTIDLADLSIQNLGKVPIASLGIQPDWFGGMPNPDTWRAAAWKRIERYRKGALSVKVVDAKGRPVRGATVKVDQVRHRFHFGTAVPAYRIVSNAPDDVRFRQKLLQMFNTVVFENDLKWQTLETRDYAQVDKALEWLKRNRIDVRGHNLVWGSRGNLPKGLWEMSDADLLRTIEGRVKETASRFRGRLYCWDVVNEAISERELWDRLGWDKFAQVYKWARQADPKTQLVYNENFVTEEVETGPKHRLKTEENVRYLLSHGAPLDAIGIQAHVSVPMTPMNRVIEILQELSQFGKPLEITEYDLGVWDERVSAQHMADFLTASFSVPSVQGFLMWGFWEGSHWRAKDGGAMVRLDWSDRQAATAYKSLVKGKWWTRYTGRTDALGDARTRAFYGTQRVTVGANSRQRTQTVELAPNRPVTVLIRL